MSFVSVSIWQIRLALPEQFAMAMVFWTGLGSSVLTAAAYAALDYIAHKFSADSRRENQENSCS